MISEDLYIDSTNLARLQIMATIVREMHPGGAVAPEALTELSNHIDAALQVHAVAVGPLWNRELVTSAAKMAHEPETAAYIDSRNLARIYMLQHLMREMFPHIGDIDQIREDIKPLWASCQDAVMHARNAHEKESG